MNVKLCRDIKKYTEDCLCGSGGYEGKKHSIFFLRFKLPCFNSDAPNTMLALNACTNVYKTALKVLANEKTLCIKNGPLMHAFILGEEVKVSF